MSTTASAGYTRVDKEMLKKAYQIMCLTQAMDKLYTENQSVTGRYRHSTSRGHEAIQIAAAMHLKPFDYVAPYYRDEALLLGLGISPEDLIKTLLGKKTDFSSGKTYYLQTPLKKEGLPTILFTGAGTGMHLIPATGAAQGLTYLAGLSSFPKSNQTPLVLCSLGDGALANGEASEALNIAVLKKLPIIFLVQDNDWMASATAEEIRAMDAYEFASGFKGLKRTRVNGADFVQAFEALHAAFEYVRTEHVPVLLHVKCPLLGDHSSALRKEEYRSAENLELHGRDEPISRLRKYLVIEGESDEEIEELGRSAYQIVKEAFQNALSIPEIAPLEIEKTALSNEFIPSGIIFDSGNRNPAFNSKISFGSAAVKTLDNILSNHPEALFFGRDIGRLGGLFGEAKNLASTHGSHRVFNMPAVPSYLIGSTAGLSSVGCKPIIEIQSGEELWGGLHQLVNIVSKSSYLSDGIFPVQALIRVLIGGKSGSGPYEHTGLETALLTVKGVKIVYPSNAADMKGLMKAAFLDPNPVILLENKALYESEAAFDIEPDENYVIPLGKSNVVQKASEEKIDEGYTCTIITYGTGVYRAKSASETFPGSVEIVDLRSLYPLDFEGIMASVKRHSKVLILTEESISNSFAESLAGRISKACFKFLDAPVSLLGAADVPALPMNLQMENAVLPNNDKLVKSISSLLNY